MRRRQAFLLFSTIFAASLLLIGVPNTPNHRASVAKQLVRVGRVQCGLVKNRWVPVMRRQGGQYISQAVYLKQLKSSVKSSPKTYLAKLLKKIRVAENRLKVETNVCNRYFIPRILKCQDPNLGIIGVKFTKPVTLKSADFGKLSKERILSQCSFKAGDYLPIYAGDLRAFKESLIFKLPADLACFNDDRTLHDFRSRGGWFKAGATSIAQVCESAADNTPYVCTLNTDAGLSFSWESVSKEDATKLAQESCLQYTYNCSGTMTCVKAQVLVPPSFSQP